LTARNGPQNIGFTFEHTSLLALPVLFSACLAYLWAVFVLGWVGWCVWRHERIDRIIWIEFAALGVPCFILLLIPGMS